LEIIALAHPVLPLALEKFLHDSGDLHIKLDTSGTPFEFLDGRKHRNRSQFPATFHIFLDRSDQRNPEISEQPSCKKEALALMRPKIVPVLLAGLNVLCDQTSLLLGLLQCGEGSPNAPTVQIK